MARALAHAGPGGCEFQGLMHEVQVAGLRGQDIGYRYDD
jgi:hypothetical protein